jgi:glycosyltransferase involved in cell wall biosynthesis
LDQQNADVDFWRVYATQATNWWLKLAALANWRLAAAHFPHIYASVGCVVSVCEADQQLTLAQSPQTQVAVIENGVDCTYYAPDRAPRSDPPRLLFTGTSAPRNVTALHQFARNVWPLVRGELSDVELLVAGNFKPEAQMEFERYSNIHFTGRVEDIRPYFNDSDVFIAPFEETHGSKLKIAEAMAMGMPIVSTPEGIRGFPLIDGKSVLLAHSDEQFGTQIADLLQDTVLQKHLGAAARQVALDTIDWQVLGTRLRKLVEAIRTGSK